MSRAVWQPATHTAVSPLGKWHSQRSSVADLQFRTTSLEVFRRVLGQNAHEIISFLETIFYFFMVPFLCRCHCNRTVLLLVVFMFSSRTLGVLWRACAFLSFGRYIYLNSRCPRARSFTFHVAFLTFCRNPNNSIMMLMY